MKKAFLLSLITFTLPALANPLQAQVQGPPAFVDYQGMVFDSTTNAPLGSTGPGPDFVADPTNYTLHFKVFNTPTGGDPIWAEVQTVTVSLGSFSVRLGAGAKIAGLNPVAPVESIADAFSARERFLELTVFPIGQATGSVIIPRLAFQASPFSFVAGRAKLADEVVGKVTATAGSTFTGTVNVTGTGSSFSGASITGGTFSGGTFSGNGAGLTGLTAGQIPSLDASKINSGIFSTARIPNLDASKITSGIFSTARIPDLSASKITSGTLPISRGGTGSYYQNFVDTTSQQSHIAGNKSFYNYVSVNGAYNHVPTHPLEVYGSIRYDLGGGFWYAFQTSSSIAGGGAHLNNIGIWSEYGILSKYAMYVTSDKRIKKNLKKSNPQSDLESLSQLKVTDYQYIDQASYGDVHKKGFIAQEVETIFPIAITKQTGVIPDIYKSAPQENGWVELETDLKIGDRVRLVAEKAEGIFEVLEVVDGKFRTDFKPEGTKVIVFGREVDDFLSIDYDSIAVLNVSATQQIKREKDAEVKALQDENADLRSKLTALDKRLAELSAKEASRDLKLAAIEKLLLSKGSPVTHPVVIKAGQISAKSGQ